MTHLFKAAATIIVLAGLAGCTTDNEASAPQMATALPAQSSGAQDAMPVSSQPPAVPPAVAGVVPGSLRDFQENVGDLVFFDYDQSNLNPAAMDTLRKQAAWLLRYPAVTLVIEGHADERGTREYNLALGARRASAVVGYLQTSGVSAVRLETISYGKERPSCTASDERCWQENRRGISTIKSGAMMAAS
jgi:peptidoglycan-associated lipoprotein